MYKLYKLVDGEWWIHGTHEDVFTLAVAAHYLGLYDRIEQIKVVAE